MFKKKPSYDELLLEIEVMKKVLEDDENTAKIKALVAERADILKDHAEKQEAASKAIALLKDARAIIQKEFDDQKSLAFRTMELEFKAKTMDEVQKVRTEYDAKLLKMNEENYDKLKDALAKLHAEGNAQTKFTEQIALKFMDNMKSNNVPAISQK